MNEDNMCFHHADTLKQATVRQSNTFCLYYFFILGHTFNKRHFCMCLGFILQLTCLLTYLSNLRLNWEAVRASSWRYYQHWETSWENWAAAGNGVGGWPVGGFLPSKINPNVPVQWQSGTGTVHKTVGEWHRPPATVSYSTVLGPTATGPLYYMQCLFVGNV